MPLQAIVIQTQMTEKQRQCAHDFKPTIFTCNTPTKHQDVYCVKCRWHQCAYVSVRAAA